MALPGRSTAVGPTSPTVERSSTTSGFDAAAGFAAACGFGAAGRVRAKVRFGAAVDFGATKGLALATGFRLTNCFALAARLDTAAAFGATAPLVAAADMVASFDFVDAACRDAAGFEVRAGKPARAALAFFLACLAAFRLVFANFRARLNAVLAARICCLAASALAPAFAAPALSSFATAA